MSRNYILKELSDGLLLEGSHKYNPKVLLKLYKRRLKNNYLDLKYDFMKLLLEATHREPSEFNFDLFQSKVKKTSPLMKDSFRQNAPELHTFSKND